MITPLDTRLDAIYYDARSPLSRAVTVEADAEAVRITDGGEEMVWPHGKTRLFADAGPGERLRLEHDDGSGACIIVPAAFLDILRQRAPGYVRGSLFDLGDWRSVAVALAATALLGSALYLWGIRVAADAAARFAPRAAEERIGRSAASILAPSRERCADPARARLLGRVTGRLVSAAGPSGYTFRVIVARGPVVNAFAAPGGYIVVYQGLLDEMQSSEEFAGVLAHEMQHVIHKHSTRAIARQLSGGALLSLMAMDSSAIQGAAQLMNLRYQREDEEEADTDGLQLLVRARIRPDGLYTLLRRLQIEGKAGEMPAYLSSHPAVLARTRELESRARSVTATFEPLMTEEEWRGAKAFCSAWNR